MTTQTQSFPDIATKRIQVRTFRWPVSEAEQQEAQANVEQVFSHYGFKSSDMVTYWNLRRLEVQYEFAINFCYDNPNREKRAWRDEDFHTVTVDCVTDDAMLSTIGRLKLQLLERYAMDRKDMARLSSGLWSLFAYDLLHICEVPRAPEACTALQ